MKELTAGQRRVLAQRLKADPTYSKAYCDMEFMSRKELRPVRLQLELLKPELILRENYVNSTIVVFGSARLLSPEDARNRLRDCREKLSGSPRDPSLKAALRMAQERMKQSRYYVEAWRFAQLASRRQKRGKYRELVIVTGGGPGIMEAANRGAHELGAKSVGLNITLPHEQDPNPYITPELCFQFHYFSLRKMHFMMRAKALVAFPGGYGTLDELFETLTLIQTGKKSPLPVVLVGRKFWRRLIDFDFLAEEGMISHKDIELFKIVDTAAEAWEHIQRHHPRRGSGEVPASI